MQGPMWTLDMYRTQLQAAWDFLQQKPLRHYIWKSTSPLFLGQECSVVNKGGNPGIKIMNQIGNAIASERGADVFDQWAVRYLSPEDGDGNHCRHTLSYKTSLSLLLRHIELGPPDNNIGRVGAKVQDGFAPGQAPNLTQRQGQGNMTVMAGSA